MYRYDYNFKLHQFIIHGTYEKVYLFIKRIDTNFLVLLIFMHNVTDIPI